MFLADLLWWAWLQSKELFVEALGAKNNRSCFGRAILPDAVGARLRCLQSCPFTFSFEPRIPVRAIPHVQTTSADQAQLQLFRDQLLETADRLVQASLVHGEFQVGGREGIGRNGGVAE
jgi:hypothetical protein